MLRINLKQYRNFIRSFSLPAWSVPGGVFLLMFLIFGIYVPKLGAYGDDWVLLYYYHLFGFDFFYETMAWFRPFAGWVYSITTPILGETIWGYQVLGLVLRWSSAVMLWWAIGLVWPQNKRQVAWAALLFALYPGFKQQPIPMSFLPHFGALNLYLASLGLMLLPLRSVMLREKFWAYWGCTAVGMICTALGIFTIEYFIGLELLRPVLIYVTLEETGSKRSRVITMLKYWAPYLAVLIGYSIWRLFIFRFPLYQPSLVSNLISSPLATMYGLGVEIFESFVNVVVLVWAQVFPLPQINASNLRYYAVSMLAFLLALLFLSFLLRRGEVDEDQVFARQAVWVGGFALLAAGIPLWLPGYPVEITFPWDRSTLPFMLGTSLFLVGLIMLLFRYKYQMLVVAIFAAAAAGIHYQNTKLYYSEQLKSENFFWQMGWRAPGLEPGTMVLFDQLELETVSDNNITAVLNWMYAPELEPRDLPYKSFDLNIRLDSGFTGLTELAEDIPVEHIYHSLRYTGNSSDALVVVYDADACMRVLKPGDEDLPGLSELSARAIKISHEGQILPVVSQAAVPPLMFSEPDHTWCYYFQKADLARQQKDWQMVVDLGEEAFGQGFYPAEKTELFPLIEGYGHLDDWEKAKELSQEVLRADEDNQTALCTLWDQVFSSTEMRDREPSTVEGILVEVGCAGSQGS